jgi:DNA-binding protein HU-beta
VTKADLVNAIAEQAGLSKADAEKALKAFTGAVTNALVAEEKVSLVGFGTFDVGKRAARTGKNPQTGKAIKIPAAKTPKFKAGKALKDAVNKKK